MRATIANIIDEDVICCFPNGLFLKHTYHDFGRNRPTTAMELRDMMARWADQEDEENDRFPKRNSDKQGNGNSHFDKGRGTTRETPKSASQTKKSWLLSAIRAARSRGTMTYNLRKSCTNNVRCTRSHDEGDKSGAQDFQDLKNIINVIYGRDGGFPSKRAQKLTLREILSIEPTTQNPLRYSEVQISFSRDDQWTSFSEPGKFPLVLDPVVASSQLTRVLIDGGSSLNLLFPSTLKKTGLDISKMLTPSRAPLYGIIPGNVATTLGSVVLPVNFGTKDNYCTEYIKFEVADFESSYHAILGRPHWPNSWSCPTTSTCYSRCQGRQAYSRSVVT
jgi:hypothetical protein